MCWQARSGCSCQLSQCKCKQSVRTAAPLLCASWHKRDLWAKDPFSSIETHFKGSVYSRGPPWQLQWMEGWCYTSADRSGSEAGAWGLCLFWCVCSCFLHQKPAFAVQEEWEQLLPCSVGKKEVERHNVLVSRAHRPPRWSVSRRAVC